MKKGSKAESGNKKHYLQVAKERLEHAFSVRPEWRKPATARELDFIIKSIDENYYPFSDKKNPKRAIWRQMLKEKREEMATEIKERNKTNPKNKTGDIKSGIESRRDAATTQEVGKRDPEGETGRALPFTTPISEEWTEADVAQLRADIKSRRIASEIARRLKIRVTHLNWVLTKGCKKARARWLPEIEAMAGVLLRESELKSSSGKIGAFLPPQPGPKSPFPLELVNPDAFILGEERKPSGERSIVDFPQRAGTLISNMSVDIKDGKLFVQLTVDVAEAVRMHFDDQIEKGILGSLDKKAQQS